MYCVDRVIDDMKINCILWLVLFGFFFWGLLWVILILLMFLVGDVVVLMIIENILEWLMNGLKIVGGVLLVVGVGILLYYFLIK